MTRALPLVRRTLNGSTMGTRYSAVFFASAEMDLAALAAALFAAVDQVDRQMSTWKPHSDLNRLNAAPVGAWVPLPRELMRVLAKSLEIGRITKGAFDIGVGDLVAAWGFGAPGLWPDRSGVVDRPRPVTTTALLLNERAGLACKTAALCLDLSGIAKGFGVDEMARVMDGFAVPAWLVGIDGEMQAKGVKPDGEPWAVAHERPDRSIREAMGVIELHDMAVATSGNYRHWMEVDGRIVSHTMSTTTSAPLDDTIASVTALAPTCMEADAFATAFMVLGVEEGMRMATTRGIEAIFVLKDGSVVLAEAPVLP